MARYVSDKRKSEFSYYLGDDGAREFSKRSERSRKGILKRLLNELCRVVSEELSTNERFASDLRADLGADFGKDHLFDPSHPDFSWHIVAEIMDEVQSSTVAVQFFRGLVARNLITRDGRRYMNSVPYRKGSQVQSGKLEIRGHVRVKGDKPVILQSKSTYAAQLGTKVSSGGSSASVLHLPSGSARVIKKRPSTK